MLIGLTTPASVYDETLAALPVILLLVFMVAGIYFLRELLLFTFTKILLGIALAASRSSLIVCLTAAVLSAFLDALTVRRRAHHGRRRLLSGVPSLRVGQALRRRARRRSRRGACTSCIAPISMHFARSCAD